MKIKCILLVFFGFILLPSFLFAIVDYENEKKSYRRGD